MARPKQVRGSYFHPASVEASTRPDARGSTRRPHVPSGGVDMRKTIMTMALVASASPLLAQAAQQAKDNDPTHKVAGGIGVAGWMGRIDPSAERRGMSIGDAKFASMGSGYHITSGPAAIYWNPKDAAKGN